MHINILLFFVCSILLLVAVVQADIGHARQLTKKNLANRNKSLKQGARLESLAEGTIQVQLHKPDLAIDNKEQTALRDEEEKEQIEKNTEIANKSNSDTAQNSALATHNVQRQTNKGNVAFPKVRAGNKNDNKIKSNVKNTAEGLPVPSANKRRRNQNVRRPGNNRNQRRRTNRNNNYIISDNSNNNNNNNNDVNNSNRQIIGNAINRLRNLLRGQGTTTNNNINNALNNAIRQPQQQFQQLFQGK